MSSPISLQRPFRPENPENLWRQICWVTDQIAVSGDLSSRPVQAQEQLRAWEAAGITDVFDMRGEADDSDFIHAHSEKITSHWFGVDDNGGTRSDSWFTDLTSKAAEVLASPERRALVHCHMGVNRGPSAAYAILLTLGWNHIEALRSIRDARPIAGIIYAADAAAWKARLDGLHHEEVQARVDDVASWFERNPLDIPFIIRRIGSQFAG